MKIPKMQNQCNYRLEGINEGRPVLFVCGDPENRNYHEIVYQDTCDKCDQSRPGKPSSEMPSERPQEPHIGLPEITSLGTLIFTRTHWEPPPCPPGYHRADTEGTWVLEPDIPACKHLELGTGEIGSCGYPRLTRRCKLVDSFVGPKTCSTCTKRGNDAG